MPRSIKRESAYEREGRRFWERVRAVEAPTEAWIVEGRLRRGEVRGIVAPPKAGKTVLAASLGAAVSLGEPFGGASTGRTNVLHLAAEESPGEWAMGVRPLLPKTDRWFRVAFGSPRLDTAAGLLDLRARVEFGGTGLVVVDPLWAATVGGDPGKALAGLRRLAREKDVAVLVVHHERAAGLREIEG